MKRFLTFFCLFIYCSTSFASEKVKPEELYAQSAVLMDAESGRVLFQKNGTEQLSMASTTKVMTCILALELGDMQTVATASKEAASQPKVHLGMKEGEQFYLKDLLYSLMLESHNDSAVAIAETIAGNTEEFAKLMNQKAKEIGCENTHFVTPNGLDDSDELGSHSTTATDLAMIMRYSIIQSPKRNEFLQITQTPNYAFSDLESKRTFQCYNRNSLLTMMEGVLTGKTGYTGKAGYCYVGALERDGRTFIVSLLACGWPNNTNYKWKDAKKLLEYAVENYQYYNVFEANDFAPILVKNGVSKDNSLFEESFVNVQVKSEKQQKLEVLLSEDEEVEVKTTIEKELEAPLKQGEIVGNITYTLDGEVLAQYDVVTKEKVDVKNMTWYFAQLAKMYFSL